MFVHLITKSGKKLDMILTEPGVSIQKEIMRVMAMHYQAHEEGDTDTLVNDPIIDFEVVNG